MRVLATFAGGTGHFLPTLPYARQLRARGHQVRYACQQAMVAVVEDAGFPPWTPVVRPCCHPMNGNRCRQSTGPTSSAWWRTSSSHASAPMMSSPPGR